MKCVELRTWSGGQEGQFYAYPAARLPSSGERGWAVRQFNDSVREGLPGQTAAVMVRLPTRDHPMKRRAATRCVAGSGSHGSLCLKEDASCSGDHFLWLSRF